MKCPHCGCDTDAPNFLNPKVSVTPMQFDEGAKVWRWASPDIKMEYGDMRPVIRFGRTWLDWGSYCAECRRQGVEP